ncbi:MAG: DUF1800 domain-containing protein [Cyclobacteriaceae bacterium]|jgi:uncharacterized protein (DUF1800 family)|nr:DUF1800 domain-containing protein [Cyclobacteriaceae bacterium]
MKRTSTGIEEYSGDWGEKQVMHLLRRTLFGVSKTQLEHNKGLSFEQCIEQVISYSPIPSPPVNDYEGNTNNPDPDIPFGETWIAAPFFENNNENRRRDSLKGWLIKNTIEQETTIHEKMLLFLHNLLVVDRDNYTKLQFQYFDLLRKNSLGNYKLLMHSLTLNPAMLRYLNGNDNTVKAPDENYGRELQELFCIGKGPNSKYTESDVREAARVLTGWKIYYNDIIEKGIPGSNFLEGSHDSGDKQFSEFYGNKIISGRTGSEAGAIELSELLEMIFDNNEASLYICRRLYTFFVYTEIDEDTETNVIEPLAQIFREGSYELQPVLMALFKSAHFYEDSNIGALVKSPIEFVVGLWKGLGMKYTNLGDISLTYYTNKALNSLLINMGMDIGDPPNVAGWPVYYQAPLFDKSWITTDTITVRAEFTDGLANNGIGVTNNNDKIWVKPDLIAFIESLNEPADPNKLLQEINSLLLGISISEQEMDFLKSILLSGQDTDSYWSEAWYAYLENPSDVEAKGTIQTRLETLFKSFLQLGEVHLM